MKNVTGGGEAGCSGSSNFYVCYWESPTDSGCMSDPYEAEFMGTQHWCCNNWEAKEKCCPPDV